MTLHRFSIGELTELAPHEHPELLGLNENKGERIKLRLRTDRYDGLRSYLDVRMVLCHELTHCVWGDHDDNVRSLLPSSFLFFSPSSSFSIILITKSLMLWTVQTTEFVTESTSSGIRSERQSFDAYALLIQRARICTLFEFSSDPDFFRISAWRSVYVYVYVCCCSQIRWEQSQRRQKRWVNDYTTHLLIHSLSVDYGRINLDNTDLGNSPSLDPNLEEDSPQARRERVLAATLRRLEKEEAEIENMCGSVRKDLKWYSHGPRCRCFSVLTASFNHQPSTFQLYTSSSTWIAW